MNDEDVKALRRKKAKERRAALTAGRAWAESDRSYNAVKATVEYFAAVIHYGFEDPVSDFHYQIMMKEVGKDDTEFNEVMNGDTKKRRRLAFRRLRSVRWNDWSQRLFRHGDRNFC